MNVDLHPALTDDPKGTRAQEILRKCVHCGFCNATCPTYRLTGAELDGPRGRIYLIKELLETKRANPIASRHLDRCLTCRNCETTCPSGVEYGELAEFGREFLAHEAPSKSWLRRVLLSCVPKPKLLRVLVRAGRLVRVLLPEYLAKMLSRAPQRFPLHQDPDAKVVLLQGCVQRVLTADVVAHLQGLLETRGISSTVVEQERCCGGLALHLGESERTQEDLATNLRAFRDHADATFISTASGCAVTLKEYGRLLPEDPEASKFAERVKDVAEYLKGFKFKSQPNIRRVAFQSPCTLQHGQKINGVVEEILTECGYELVDVTDSHLCCGSAGTYSILQSDMAARLKDEKMRTLTKHLPDVIATANVGCQLHLSPDAPVPVVHWVKLLK